MHTLRQVHHFASARGYALFLCVFLGIASGAFAQKNQACTLTLRLHLYNNLDSQALDFARVYVQEKQQDFATDAHGYLSLSSLCRGTYRLHLSHVGCVEKVYTISLHTDTSIHLSLEHHPNILETVLLHSHTSADLHRLFSLSEKEIGTLAHKDIADVLTELTGVRLIQTGVGIAKPQIEGLQNERIDILNHGVVQAGQVWGNEHALEIDAFAAQRIDVLKGTDILPYSGSLGGNVLQISPSRVGNDSNLRIRADYFFNTNNLGNTVHTKLSKFNAILPFWVGLTWKKSADSRAPNYYLTNTGKNEWDAQVQLEKSFKNIDFRLYYSFYRAETGLLLGSQIGNLTDLKEAITRPIPFFTRSDFSYNIAPPRQQVSHHLAKLDVDWHFRPNQHLVAFYATQWNDRQEFDVRRAGRSSQAALSLFQFTGTAHAFFEQTTSPRHWSYKAGAQFSVVHNTNDPATGILPIVPNYNELSAAHFFSISKEIAAWKLSGGYRLGYQQLAVAKVQRFPPAILQQQRRFFSYAFTLDAQYTLPKLQSALSVIYGMRNPTIYELYSQGLHQGVSGIEEGNDALNSEKSVKISASLAWKIASWVELSGNVFYQKAKDFIYLQVQPTFRLTIRGAFPVYKMQQSDVTLYGGDARLTLYPFSGFRIEGRYNTVRGNNETENNYLTGMPSDKLTWNVGYDAYLFKGKSPLKLSVGGTQVFRQDRLSLSQDFLVPPPGYFLLHGKLEQAFTFHHKERLVFTLTGENMLNTPYRNYTNRLRYFSDELGIAMVLHVAYEF